MKSIKEKAKEVERNTHPLFESISESTGEPVSVYDQNDMIDMFEAGANYVLNLLSETIHVSKDAYLKNNLFELIKQLKK